MVGYAAVLYAVLATEPPSPGGPEPGASSPENLAQQPPPAEGREVPAPAGVSPIELIPRIEVRHAFAQISDAARASTTTTHIDITFARRLLLRYEVPHRRVVEGDQSFTGLGDMQIEAIGVVTSGPRHVAALEVGMVLDTASRPQLGAGKQQVFLGAIAAAKPLRFWVPFLIVRQRMSVAGDDTRPDVNQLFVRVGNIVFGKRWDWYRLDLDATVDFPAGAGRLYGTVELGSLLIGRVGLFVRAGTQLAGQRQLDYTVLGGVRYLFRLEEPRRSSETAAEPGAAARRESEPR